MDNTDKLFENYDFRVEDASLCSGDNLRVRFFTGFRKTT